MTIWDLTTKISKPTVICEFRYLFDYSFLYIASFYSYDRDEETESETKIRMPQEEYDNMDSAGKEAAGRKLSHRNRSVDAIKTI